MERVLSVIVGRYVIPITNKCRVGITSFYNSERFVLKVLLGSESMEHRFVFPETNSGMNSMKALHGLVDSEDPKRLLDKSVYTKILSPDDVVIYEGMVAAYFNARQWLLEVNDV